MGSSKKKKHTSFIFVKMSYNAITAIGTQNQFIFFGTNGQMQQTCF